MSSSRVSVPPKMYFSYHQFMVFDADVRLPGCAWTPEHSAQGFARRESVVNFNTLLEFGEADVVVGEVYQPRDDYARVIAVPFLVMSGRVIIEGPEETTRERHIDVRPGFYRLVAAQRLIGEEQQQIDLFFEPRDQPVEHSTILIADDELTPPPLLLETAGIAGVD
jgi:hypothetical protein